MSSAGDGILPHERGAQKAASSTHLLGLVDRDPLEFAALHSAHGRRWVVDLPVLVGLLSERWGLEVDESSMHSGYNSVVLPVRRSGDRFALKLTWPESTAVYEARALRVWRADGAVSVVEEDLEVGALLLEWLDPTSTLEHSPLEEAGQIAGRLIRTLATPTSDEFPSLGERARSLVEDIDRRQSALRAPVPREWFEAARDSAQSLGVVATVTLIHADLHYGNILRRENGQWAAIDPKPIIGDPEFAIPELMWTRVDELRTGRDIENHLATIVEAGDLDLHKARAWAVARCVDYWLWGLEQGLTLDPSRCRRVVEALLSGGG